MGKKDEKRKRSKRLLNPDPESSIEVTGAANSAKVGRVISAGTQNHCIFIQDLHVGQSHVGPGRSEHTKDGQTVRQILLQSFSMEELDSTPTPSTSSLSQPEDIASQKLQRSKQEMLERKRTVRDNISVYQTFINNNRKEMRRLEVERKSLESAVDGAFSLMTKYVLDELERHKTKKLNDIHNHMEKRLGTLVHKLDVAEFIVASAGKDLDDTALKNFTGLLDEYEEFEKKQRETSYTQFVMSNCLVERLAALLSEFDFGYLRETDITQIKSQEDRGNFLKDIAPSWAILPKRGELTLLSLVRCPYFQFDPRTVWADRSILPDGSLYNHPPSQPHPPSDRRLRKYYGSVGTTRFSQGGVYMWVNKVNINLEEKLKERYVVFEVALCPRGVFDKDFTTDYTSGILSLSVIECADHTTDSVCLKVSKGHVEPHHQILFPNRTGQLPPLVYGFLLDTIRHRWTVYDVTKKEEITTVEEIGDVEEFTPMFGVYATTPSSVKLSLITGTDLNIQDDMHSLIESTLTQIVA